MGVISSVRSLKVNFENAVCVESTAVGKTEASTPAALMIGNATVNEHFPTQDTSCTVIILFIYVSFLKYFFYISSDIAKLSYDITVSAFYYFGIVYNTLAFCVKRTHHKRRTASEIGGVCFG